MSNRVRYKWFIILRIFAFSGHSQGALEADASNTSGFLKVTHLTPRTFNASYKICWLKWNSLPHRWEWPSCVQQHTHTLAPSKFLTFKCSKKNPALTQLSRKLVKQLVHLNLFCFAASLQAHSTVQFSSLTTTIIVTQLWPWCGVRHSTGLVTKSCLLYQQQLHLPFQLPHMWGCS